MAWYAFFLVVLFSLWATASSLPRNDALPDLHSWFDEKHFEICRSSIEEQTEDFVCALVNDVAEVRLRRGTYRTESFFENSEVNLSLMLSFDVFPLPLFLNDTFSLDPFMYLIVSDLLPHHQDIFRPPTSTPVVRAQRPGILVISVNPASLQHSTLARRRRYSSATGFGTIATFVTVSFTGFASLWH
ncbi:hypothetical protein QOT17_025351 [Balamuthia mandrillaris]